MAQALFHSADCKRALRREDTAVSEVLSSLILVGITVLAAAGFAFFIANIDPPEQQAPISLEAYLVPGDGGWGTGDERVLVRHLGGPALRADDTIIQITGPQGDTLYAQQTLAGAFDDGRLSIGEHWSVVVNAPNAADFQVIIVRSEGSGSRLIFDGAATPLAGAPA